MYSLLRPLQEVLGHRGLLLAILWRGPKGEGHLRQQTSPEVRKVIVCGLENSETWRKPTNSPAHLLLRRQGLGQNEEAGSSDEVVAGVLSRRAQRHTGNNLHRHLLEIHNLGRRPLLPRGFLPPGPNAVSPPSSRTLLYCLDHQARSRPWEATCTYRTNQPTVLWSSPCLGAIRKRIASAEQMRQLFCLDVHNKGRRNQGRTECN